jgi:hypothetical protein
MCIFLVYGTTAVEYLRFSPFFNLSFAPKSWGGGNFLVCYPVLSPMVVYEALVNMDEWNAGEGKNVSGMMP